MQKPCSHKNQQALPKIPLSDILLGILAGVTQKVPFAIFSGAQSQKHFLAFDLTPYDPKTLLERDFINRSSEEDQANSFASGFVGIIPYARPHSVPNLRVYYATGVITIDSERGVFSASGCLGAEGQAIYEWLLALSFDPHRQETLVSKNLHLFQKGHDPLVLSPLQSAKAYLGAAKKALLAIGRGRFYQINLLRFFDLEPSLTPFSPKLLTRWVLKSGPFSSFLFEGEKAVVSFSPERFLQVTPQDSQRVTLTMSPIKGSCANSEDPLDAEKLGAELLKSKKNRAELSMIIDLMRNDLLRLALQGTVALKSEIALHRYKTIQHLMATVSGEALSSITFKDLIKALCPSGSITGAPKVEVHQAISAWEALPRDEFMGNMFYWDEHSKHFDANVLIRTIVFTRSKEVYAARYAAGSGIVMHSDPFEELKEIATKCLVIES